MYAAGTVIASLLGAVYVAPLLILLHYAAALRSAERLRRLLERTIRPKRALIACTLLLATTALSHSLRPDMALTLSSSAYVLSVIFAASVLIAKPVLARRR